MIKTKATQILKTLSRPRNIKYEKHLLLKVESPFLVEKVIHLQYITSSIMTYWVGGFMSISTDAWTMSKQCTNRDSLIC